MKEIWKDIIGYEGLYQVSNLGNVRKIKKNGIIKSKNVYLHKTNYVVSTFCKNGFQKTFRVHRLVAQAFIPNPNNKPYVNHKDGNKQNNCVSNLEWVTHIENMEHSKTLHIKDNRKKKCCKMINGKIIKIYDSITDAAIDNNANKLCIHLCLHKKHKKCCGFEWSFIN